MPLCWGTAAAELEGANGDVDLGLHGELQGKTMELQRHEGSYSNLGNMDIPEKKML